MHGLLEAIFIHVVISVCHQLRIMVGYLTVYLGWPRSITTSIISITGLYDAHTFWGYIISINWYTCPQSFKLRLAYYDVQYLSHCCIKSIYFGLNSIEVTHHGYPHVGFDRGSFTQVRYLRGGIFLWRLTVRFPHRHEELGILAWLVGPNQPS